MADPCFVGLESYMLSFTELPRKTFGSSFSFAKSLWPKVDKASSRLQDHGNLSRSMCRRTCVAAVNTYAPLLISDLEFHSIYERTQSPHLHQNSETISQCCLCFHFGCASRKAAGLACSHVQKNPHACLHDGCADTTACNLIFTSSPYPNFPCALCSNQAFINDALSHSLYLTCDLTSTTQSFQKRTVSGHPHHYVISFVPHSVSDTCQFPRCYCFQFHYHHSKAICGS